MARGRMLNIDISDSVKFQNLPDDTCRLLATWTIAHLDKNGVFHGEPALVRSKVMPWREDISSAQVAIYLTAMQNAGLIRMFEAAGHTWQVWPGFRDNQPGLHADRERTRFPEPPDIAGVLPEVSGKLPETSGSSRQKSPTTTTGTTIELQQQQEQEHNNKGDGDAAPSVAAVVPPDALSLLSVAGVGEPLRSQLAVAHPYERIGEVVTFAQANGKGPGWIVGALRHSWDVRDPPAAQRRDRHRKPAEDDSPVARRRYIEGENAEYVSP